MRYSTQNKQQTWAMVLSRPPGWKDVELTWWKPALWKSISDELLCFYCFYLFIFDILCKLPLCSMDPVCQSLLYYHANVITKISGDDVSTGHFESLVTPEQKVYQYKMYFTWSKHNSYILQLCTQSSSQHINVYLKVRQRTEMEIMNKDGKN